jgi:hypothetical protein
MLQAPAFEGPVLTLFYFFRARQCFICARQCASARPQRAQVPQKTRGPKLNLKSEAPKSGVAGTQTYFLFPASVFQCGAPKGPQNVRLQNLKIDAPKSGAPNVFSLFQRGIQTTRGPEESKAPNNGAPK